MTNSKNLPLLLRNSRPLRNSRWSFGEGETGFVMMDKKVATRGKEGAGIFKRDL